MPYHDWLPASWMRNKDDQDAPFLALRKQVDSLFNDFDNGLQAFRNDFAVRSNVSETDDEVCITAELPGLTDKDVDVTVVGNRITIKGEKKSETDEHKDEEGRQYHRIERTSGSFERTMTVPFEIDAEAVQADVKDGVLTVKIGKPADVVAKTNKIEVTHSK